MDKRRSDILINDLIMWIFKHTDTGFEIAINSTKEPNIKVPMLKTGL